ncbi:heme ABC transporter ATP-binding protein [Actibacterium lipolyticum]|uniref:Hemin import ATP-binding protein HmuV n=1 Tax=Actibacterium lipolyticum TaxID=1524263 RepID=A0A238KIC9_9RHOB|nr:heme ABC transporter ATP-binding protein [Actibacterium lipolyticum]SMX42460.1 Hemin import ATP-binding protein HmuV [Actibacterium lipolyticum]
MMFEAKNVVVSLGRKQILHHVGFTARAGELTAIVGPNGSGKTTLLRALTGDAEYSGEIAINGQDTQSLKGWELAAMRGVLPQAAVLAFPFTAIEVVRLGLTAGLSAGNTRLPTQALDAVGLHGFANRFYQELSGGEQQRVQLARILTQVWEPVVDGVPRWLLLDEPVASLDIGHQLKVMQLVQQYAKRGGGVIAVMHDLNLTAMFADSVTMMCNGQVAGSGPVDEVLNNQTLSTAYGCSLRVNTMPPFGGTFLLPHSASQPTMGH